MKFVVKPSSSGLELQAEGFFPDKETAPAQERFALQCLNDLADAASGSARNGEMARLSPLERLRWVEILESGVVRTHPFLAAESILEVRPEGSGDQSLLMWLRAPGNEQTRQLSFDGTNLFCSRRPVTPGKRVSSGLVRLYHQGDHWRFDREGGQLIVDWSCVCGILSELLVTVGGKRDFFFSVRQLEKRRFQAALRGKLHLQFRAFGLPLPLVRTIRVEADRGSEDVGAKERWVSLPLAPDGSLNPEALELEEVPERLRCRAIYTMEVDGKELSGETGFDLWCETSLREMTLYAGEAAVDDASGVAEIDGVGFLTETPAPKRLTLRMAAGEREATMVLERHDAVLGAVAYRAPGLGRQILETFEAPAVVRFFTQRRFDVGRLTLEPDQVEGRWELVPGGRLVFRPRRRSELTLNLIRPYLDARGGSRWRKVDDLEQAHSSIFWAELHYTDHGERVRMRAPLVREASPGLRLVDFTELESRRFDRTQKVHWIEVEPLRDQDRATQVHLWIPPLENRPVHLQVVGGRLRLLLPALTVDDMALRPTRLWAGDQEDIFRLDGWCHAVFPPEGEWERCLMARRSVLLEPDVDLFVDYQGLCSGASLESVEDPFGGDYRLLLLKDGWDLTGLRSMKIDGGMLAPLCAATQTVRPDLDYCFWIQDLNASPRLVRLRMTRSRGLWAVNMQPALPAEGEDALLELSPPRDGDGWVIEPVPGQSSSAGTRVMAWRGLVFEISVEGNPTVCFRGWLWPDGGVGRFKTQPPARAYELSVAGESVHGGCWVAELELVKATKCYQATWLTDAPPDEVALVLQRYIKRLDFPEKIAVDVAGETLYYSAHHEPVEGSRLKRRLTLRSGVGAGAAADDPIRAWARFSEVEGRAKGDGATAMGATEGEKGDGARTDARAGGVTTAGDGAGTDARAGGVTTAGDGAGGAMAGRKKHAF